MSEVTTATNDPPASALEQAGSSPTSNGSGNPVKETMGSGLFATDTTTESTEGAPGHPDEAGQDGGNSPSSSPESAAAQDPKEQERGYLRQQDYTRKTMELADERRQFAQEREQWLRNREEAIRNAQAPPTNNGQHAPASLAQQMQSFAQQLATDPNVNPVDRQGVVFMAQAVQTMEEQKAAIEELRTKLSQYEPHIQHASQMATQMTQREQQAVRDRVSTEVAKAKEMFGEDTFQNVAGLLLPVLRDVLSGNPPINLKTSKPWTVPELVAGFSGRSVEDAEAARSGNHAGRIAAKRGAAVPSSTADAPAPANGFLSREQSIALIRSQRKAAGLA